MLLCFLDETYTKDEYYIGAVVAPDACVLPLTRGFSAVIDYASSAFGVQVDAELHGYEIMGGSGAWKPLRGKHNAAVGIYKRALSVVASCDLKVFVRGVHVGRLNERYRYPWPPHRIALQHVLEDVHAYAHQLGEKVLVVADEVADQDHHTHMVQLYSLNGTGGYKPSRLETIVQPIRFQPSHENVGLQAADLVAYLYRRRFCHIEKSLKAENAVQSMWEIIAPQVLRNWRWDP